MNAMFATRVAEENGGANRVTPEKGTNQNFATSSHQDIAMLGMPLYERAPTSLHINQAIDDAGGVRNYCMQNSSSIFSSSTVAPPLTPMTPTKDDNAALLKHKLEEQQKQLQEMSKALNAANAQKLRLAQELQSTQAMQESLIQQERAKHNQGVYDYICFTLKSGTTLFPSQLARDNDGSVHNYRIGVTLGKGGFGSVAEAWQFKTQTTIALKIVDADNGFLDNEIRALRRANHPNIIKLYDVVHDYPKNKCGLALELCEMDLIKYYHTFGGFSLEDLRQISLALLKALAYLHSQSICHMDVKPDNLLVKIECPSLCGHSSLCQHRIKLCDFGLVAMADAPSQEPVYGYNMKGTANYFAPEMAGSQRYNAAAADMWSVGATSLAFQLSMSQAWVDAYQWYNDPNDIGHVSFKAGLRDVLHNLNQVESSSPAMDLTRRLLKEDAAERLTAEGALQHMWLQE